MKRISTLEKMYGVTIVKDWNDGTTQYYKMYSADGCSWENGLTIKGLNRECEEYAHALLDIKNKVQQ